MKNFWDAVRESEKEHQDYINHIMACEACNAPAGRYCESGTELLRIYRAASEKAMRGV